jgi:hypothetical protein
MIVGSNVLVSNRGIAKISVAHCQTYHINLDLPISDLRAYSQYPLYGKCPLDGVRKDELLSTTDQRDIFCSAPASKADE